jgi:glycosyltransferase involved in cell wall biosynthesis
MQDGPVSPKIFLVAPGGLNGSGGIGRLVSITARHWQSIGAKPPMRVIDSYGGRLSLLTPLYFVRALVQIAWHAMRGHIALLHVHVAARGSTLRKGVILHLAAWMGVPILLHQHGSRIDDMHAKLPNWARRRLRRTMQLADRIVVPGTYWRNVLVDKVGIDPTIVRVVGQASGGPTSITPHPRTSCCELLFLGNLTARKGLPELLRALAQPDVASLAWRLRVAGNGDARPFAARATALGIADRVEFLGLVPEAGVSGLLTRADVFVLPSYNEGLSVAMLEAMAHGCAVVATPVGGNPDAVRDGDSALLVPPGDVTRLAVALRRVIVEPELRAALQTRARQRWLEGFDIASHCRQLATLYRELCPSLEMEAAPETAAIPSFPPPSDVASARPTSSRIGD